MLLRSIIAILMVAGLFQVEANAQRRVRPLKKVNRALGLWTGSGYHYQNPGPQGGYYNPYTAHNSGLVTQGYVPPHLMMMSQSPNIGTSVVMPPNDQAFPPAPIGGSYESFDNEFQVESPSEGEDLSTPNSEPKEKDGFDFDEDNDVFDKGNDADDEKTMLHDLPRNSNVDFELPQDSLDFTLHDN